MNKKVPNPIFGEIYMASRYYNSKRIVREPFLLTETNPPPYTYRGTWLLDNKKGGSFGPIEEFDPKWVERKIKALREEANDIQDNAKNLDTALLQWSRRKGPSFQVLK